jgi:aspartyl-tRNA synthetase
MEDLVVLYHHWRAAEAVRAGIADKPYSAQWLAPSPLSLGPPAYHQSSMVVGFVLPGIVRTRLPQTSANLPSVEFGFRVWLALLYVVIEAYENVGRRDFEVDKLLREKRNVSLLQRIRNAQFHPTEDPLAVENLFTEQQVSWADELGDAFQRFFARELNEPAIGAYVEPRKDRYSIPPNIYRSHTCGVLTATDVDRDAWLSGWCHRIRDHGGVLFVDLRDHYGLTQVVIDPDSPAFKIAETLRSEWVVRVEGRVRRRPVGTENTDLPTGAIELYCYKIVVLGQSAELPMPVFGEQEYPEDIRLKYRFLDLRRERLHQNIIKRGRIIDSIRQRMKEQGFFEFQTPILTASSPEGARDYLVPSRVHPGKFYALPQAPQQFKQLIMVSGFDRYFQIAPCFRDEDARADRSPGEFYQLDIEMSFATQDDVFAAVEPVLRDVFKQFGGGKSVTQKFPQISYTASINAFGTDKPDLRNPLVIHDVTNVFRDSGFGLFARAVAADPNVRIWAIPAPTGGSRAFCDRMDSWAKGEGQPGLGYIFWRDNDDSGAGPIAKNLGPERTSQLKKELNGQLGQFVRVPLPLEEQTSMEHALRGSFPISVASPYRNLRPAGLLDGDAVFFLMGRPVDIHKFAGLARTRVGEELNLVAKDCFEFCWIVDFPMYEWNEQEKKIDFSHNPFSMPNYPIEDFLKLQPGQQEKILGIKAFQYDIVCNGIELSSGAIRNHRHDVMHQAFLLAGYGGNEIETKFSALFKAFQYGAPPHGGIAPGIDRIVMLLCGEENLREVVLFPMNQRAEDLLMGAPSEVSAKQLRELNIRVVNPGPG